MRRKYYWSSEKMRWVDHPTKTRRHSGISVIRDIEPYRAVTTGEVIGGRRQHREFLRANDYVEFGNERPQRRDVALPDPDMAIKRAMAEHGYD